MLIVAYYGEKSLQQANSFVASFNYFRAIRMIAPIDKDVWILVDIRKLFKKKLGHRVCPPTDALYDKIDKVNPVLRRLLWIFCLGSVLCLRAAELTYLHPSYFKYNQELGFYEIHFPRPTCKRDSWIMRCPTWASEWIQAFCIYYKREGVHPLNVSIPEYRKALKLMLNDTVAASARHVGASYAWFVGTAHTTISDFLGHKSMATVEVYIHRNYKCTKSFHDILQKFVECYDKTFVNP